MNAEVLVQSDTENNITFLYLFGFLRTEEKKKRKKEVNVCAGGSPGILILVCQ